jgi:hypothetical protein
MFSIKVAIMNECGTSESNKITTLLSLIGIVPIITFGAP